MIAFVTDYYLNFLVYTNSATTDRRRHECMRNTKHQIKLPETVSSVVACYPRILASHYAAMRAKYKRVTRALKVRCKNSKVVDIKKSQVDHPTGDPKFSVLEAFPHLLNALKRWIRF